MAAPQRPSGRRGPSGAWSRLKNNAPTDPLLVYGLPSKGETRLNNHKVQEEFYNAIVERYMKFCHQQKDDLDKQFSLLSLSSSQDLTSSLPGANNGKTNISNDSAAKSAISDLAPQSFTNTSSSGSSSSNTTGGSSNQPGATATTTTTPTASAELQLIHAAMRKLREAIVSSRRNDGFARRAYVFLVRASILTSSWESYQPALLYLLGTIHARSPLTAAELREFASYLVLDLACRQADLHGAHKMRLAYGLGGGGGGGGDGGAVQRSVGDLGSCIPSGMADGTAAAVAAVTVSEVNVEGACEGSGAGSGFVDEILQALVTDDWVLFRRLKRRVDGYVRALMAWAEEGMRVHALKCLGRTYLSVGKDYVEQSTGKSWEELKAGGVGWELAMEEGQERIIIRKPKAKG